MASQVMLVAWPVWPLGGRASREQPWGRGPLVGSVWGPVCPRHVGLWSLPWRELCGACRPLWVSGASRVWPRVCACPPMSTCAALPLRQRRAAVLGAEPGVTARSPLVSSTFFWGQERRRGNQWPPCQWSRWACDHVRGLPLSLPPPEQPPGLLSPRPGPQKPTSAHCPPAWARVGAWHVWEWMHIFIYSFLSLFLFLLKMVFFETELVYNIM